MLLTLVQSLHICALMVCSANPVCARSCTFCFINITEEPLLKECQYGKHQWSLCADRIKKFGSTYICHFEYIKY